MKDILEKISTPGYVHSLPYSEFREVCFDAAEEISRLRNAIKETLEENRHLADGDNCTLLKLKQILELK